MVRHASGDPDPKSDPPRPTEVREFDGRVWDVVENLAHPAFIFAAAQVALWSAYETSASFRSPDLGFWARSGVHAAQFLGAWAVLYGTFLRDMHVGIRATTGIVWSGVIGAVVAWAWPDREAPESARGLWLWLSLQLAICVVGWIHTFRIWRIEKARHEAIQDAKDRQANES